ncbi:MAG: HTTM domain-containing protein [Gemmataceae bacterium]
MSDNRLSTWTRFWHEPVRAERLALMRGLLGLALLADQLFQYLPNLMEFFGPTGVAPAGLHDAYQLRQWRWTVLLFNHDDPAVVYPLFWAWVGVTAAWTAGLLTRLTGVLVWFGTLCWVYRNPNILNGGDDTLQVGLFLLMLSPCGRALSLDALLFRRPPHVPPWSVRLIQLQLCVVYLTTGFVKLVGEGVGPHYLPKGTWWDGTSIHYALNYVTMSRWSFAQLPLPLWATAPLTYVSVWWETLFPLLVLWRRTRPYALWFGVLFHVGIWLTIEVGWFSFYTLSLYGVWVPDRFWERLAGCEPRTK